jgi:uncharacterized OsmC-like protein
MNEHERAPTRATIGPEGFLTSIVAGGHALSADEPGNAGGADAGPDPFALLDAALAACVLITLRMYATRKGWPLEGAAVTVLPERKGVGPLDAIALELRLDGDGLTESQRARLLEVAGRCPVHRTLEKPLEIETRLVGA